MLCPLCSKELLLRLQLSVGFRKALWKADSPAACDTGLLSQAEWDVLRDSAWPGGERFHFKAPCFSSSQFSV